MKRQDWIFSVRYYYEAQGPVPPDLRWAVVGPARASTVEAALHLAQMPEELRAEIRSSEVVRDFVEGRLDPDKSGYYAHSRPATVFTAWRSWAICIGSVHEVLDR